MPLQVASHPVVVVAEPVGKEAALGIEQQARGFDRRSRDNNEVGGLLLETLVLVEVRNSRGVAAIVGELTGDAPGAHDG